jgi:hypothetical protein
MRVLQQVVKTSDAGRLSLFDELRGAAGHEHGLHVGLGLRQVEQLPRLVLPPISMNRRLLLYRTFESERAGTSTYGSRRRPDSSTTVSAIS